MLTFAQPSDFFLLFSIGLGRAYALAFAERGASVVGKLIHFSFHSVAGN